MPEVKEVQPDIFSVTKEYELPEAGLHEITLTKIEDLGLVELILRDVALTKRRHPEVDERTRQLCAAQTALIWLRHRTK